MTRFPIRDGNASAATSFTIAFARLADVIVDISLLSDCLGALFAPFSLKRTGLQAMRIGLKAANGLRSQPGYFLTHPIEIFLIHSRLDLLDLYAGRSPVGCISCGRLGAASAGDSRGQQLGILLHEARQIFLQRLAIRAPGKQAPVVTA